MVVMQQPPEEEPTQIKQLTEEIKKEEEDPIFQSHSHKNIDKNGNKRLSLR
jgi:hypothetical protein